MRSRKGGGFWNVRSRKCWFPALVRVREWQCSEHASGSKHRCGAWDCIRIISYLCNHSKHLETIYWILLIYIYINHIQSHSVWNDPSISNDPTQNHTPKCWEIWWTSHGPMTPWPHLAGRKDWAVPQTASQFWFWRSRGSRGFQPGAVPQFC